MRYLIATIACLLSLSAAPAWATQYWYGLTGSDANTCGSVSGAEGGAEPGSLKLTLMSAAACLASGDIVHGKAGTYTGSGARFYENTVNIPNGTLGNETIIEGEGVDGCAITHTCPTILRMSGAQGSNLNDPSYIIIRKLDIDNINMGGGDNCLNTGGAGTRLTLQDVELHNCRHNGIFNSHDVSFLMLDRVNIHDVSLDGTQSHGCYLDGDDATLQYSIIHDVGTHAGVLGCQFFTNSPTSANGADRAHVHHNQFYNNTNGTAVTIDGPDCNVHHNLFYNNTNGIDLGLTPGSNNCKLNNNVFYGQAGWAAQIGLFSVSGINVEVKNNIALNNGSGNFRDLNWANDGAASNNKITGTITDCTVSTSDFTQKSGSSCIDAGIAISGLAFNGAAPDIGAFESFTRVSSTVNENFLDTTWGMNLNTPITSSGITGVTALLSAVARTTLSSAKLAGTDSVVRTIFNGAACVGGGAWTETYVPGNITDSALIGGTLNQKGFGYTAAVVTNNCGTAPPPPPAGPLIIYTLNDNTGTTATNTGSSGAPDNGTLTATIGWGTGKNSFGVVTTDAADGYVAIPHGNAVNPSSASLTIAFWVLIPSNITSAPRAYFGVDHAGADTRFYISTLNSLWRIGIQASPESASTTNLAVVAGWNRVCLQANSATDVATLHVNGVVGTSGGAKSYTSYAIPADFKLGSPFGAPNNPGVTYDDFKLWTTAESCADDYAASEPSSPPALGTFSQVSHQFHYLRQTSGGVIENYRAQSATVNVRAGGSVQLTTQTDCTVADCSSVAERLHYNINGGAFTNEVPDSFGSDGVAFYGSTAVTDVDILKGAVSSCLSGALPCTAGGTQITASAVPVFDIAQNASTVNRRVIRFDVGVAEGTTICFKTYTQQGQAYASYTPAAGACVVIVPLSAASGF